MSTSDPTTYLFSLSFDLAKVTRAFAIQLSKPIRVGLLRELRKAALTCGRKRTRRKYEKLEPTWIGLAIAVGTFAGSTVACLDLESVSALLLTIEHDFREDLARLLVDLKVVLALVSIAVHHVIRDLHTKTIMQLHHELVCPAAVA